jgi:hypothetical protein
MFSSTVPPRAPLSTFAAIASRYRVHTSDNYPSSPTGLNLAR